MPDRNLLSHFFKALAGTAFPLPERASPAKGEFGLPAYSETDLEPKRVELTTVAHPDGRMSQYPPPGEWDDWVEWDG